MPGVLSIRDGNLHFQGTDVSVDLPLAGLQIEAGGHNNEHLFLKHPQGDGWLIITADPSITRQLSAANPETARQMAQASKARLGSGRLYILTGVFLALVAGVILLLFALKSPLARMVT